MKSDEYEKEVNSAVAEALQKMESIFGVNDVLVKVEENPENTIPETGVGGFTPDSHTIFVYYDTSNTNLKDNLRGKIKSTVAHEFHHAIRNRSFSWKEDTLLGAMVTEGLADHFDIEVNGGGPKPWSVAFADREIEMVRKIAEQEFDSREYNHNEWFFGSEDKNIPKWAGYAIGFKLVGDYLQKTGKKPSILASEPAETFLI